MRIMALLLIMTCMIPLTVKATPQTAPRLNSIENFRDAAGPGYITASGKYMRTGILYRSNQLNPSPVDLQTLASVIKVHRVYNLRTPTEIKTAPDRIPPGTIYTVIGLDENLYDRTGIHKLPASHPRTISAEHHYLEDLNRSFVTVPDKRKRLGILLTDIASTPGVQIFHCAAGKDRTGWDSAIIQLLLGVPENEVIHDYPLTNVYAAHSITQDVQTVTAREGPQFSAVEKASMIAYPAALEADIHEMRTPYGTIERYVHDGLGVSADNMIALKMMLTAE